MRLNAEDRRAIFYLIEPNYGTIAYLRISKNVPDETGLAIYIQASTAGNQKSTMVDYF